MSIRPGSERPPGKVDVAHVGGPATVRASAIAGDAPIVADEDGGMLDISAGRDVEVAVRGNHALAARRARQRKRHQPHQQSAS